MVRGDAHLRIREWHDRGYRLGREAADMLARADIFTLDDLADLGAVEAYRRMRSAAVKGLNLEMLWALGGTLTYRDRRSISTARRRDLLAELGEAPAPQPIHRRRYRAPIRPVQRAARTTHPA
jgi:TfoX C-terminal domain